MHFVATTRSIVRFPVSAIPQRETSTTLETAPSLEPLRRQKRIPLLGEWIEQAKPRMRAVGVRKKEPFRKVGH